VDNQLGAVETLSDANDLTSDLIAGHLYRFQCDAKYAGGSAGVMLKARDEGVDLLLSDYLTTDFVRYSLIFAPKSTDTCYVSLSQMGTDNVVTIDNLSLKELDGTANDYYGHNGTVDGATITEDGLVCSSAGIAYIPSSTAYGEWEFSVNKVGEGSIYAFLLNSSDITGQGYRLDINSDESIRLTRWNDGASAYPFQTVASYITIDTDYRIKVTRTLDGTFTIYIKGGVFGWDSWTTIVADSGTNPVTDNTYTTFSYFLIDFNASDTISNLKINGKRKSLANATQSTGA